MLAVRWGVAGNTVGAWVPTLPAAGVFGAVVYEVSAPFGSGAIGPLIITAVLLSTLEAVGRRLQRADPAPIVS